jgi:hypothetical protein
VCDGDLFPMALARHTTLFRFEFSSAENPALRIMFTLDYSKKGNTKNEKYLTMVVFVN